MFNKFNKFNKFKLLSERTSGAPPLIFISVRSALCYEVQFWVRQCKPFLGFSISIMRGYIKGLWLSVVKMLFTSGKHTHAFWSRIDLIVRMSKFWILKKLTQIIHKQILTCSGGCRGWIEENTSQQKSYFVLNLFRLKEENKSLWQNNSVLVLISKYLQIWLSCPRNQTSIMISWPYPDLYISAIAT